MVYLRQLCRIEIHDFNAESRSAYLKRWALGYIQVQRYTRKLMDNQRELFRY